MPERRSDGLVLAFIRAATIAWKSLSTYPPGHPFLASSVKDALRRLDELSASVGALSLGISRKGLLFEDLRLETTPICDHTKLVPTWLVGSRDAGVATEAVALFMMHYNFSRPHRSLRTKRDNRITPAMAARIASQPWKIDDLLLLEPAKPVIQVAANPMS